MQSLNGPCEKKILSCKKVLKNQNRIIEQQRLSKQKANTGA